MEYFNKQWMICLAFPEPIRYDNIHIYTKCWNITVSSRTYCTSTISYHNIQYNHMLCDETTGLQKKRSTEPTLASISTSFLHILHPARESSIVLRRKWKFRCHCVGCYCCCCRCRVQTNGRKSCIIGIAGPKTRLIDLHSIYICRVAKKNEGQLGVRCDVWSFYWFIELTRTTQYRKYIMQKEKYNTKTRNTTNVRRELYCKYWERFNIKQLVTVNNNGISS